MSRGSAVTARAQVDTGHIIYAAAGSLRAVRFDAVRLEAVGDPVTVVDAVVMGAGQADYALLRHGTLVYLPGGAAEQTLPARTLLWVDRQGKEEPLTAPRPSYAVARLSPDGTGVALDVRDKSNDIWIWNQDVAEFNQRTLAFLPRHTGAAVA